jgi:hypothetical protein
MSGEYRDMAYVCQAGSGFNFDEENEYESGNVQGV